MGSAPSHHHYHVDEAATKAAREAKEAANRAREQYLKSQIDLLILIRANERRAAELAAREAEEAVEAARTTEQAAAAAALHQERAAAAARLAAEKRLQLPPSNRSGFFRGGGPDVAGVGDEDPQTPRPTSAVAARSFFASVMPGWMVSRSTTMHAMTPSRDA